MRLTDTQKEKIKMEFDTYVCKAYESKDKKERQKMGQFFTPPSLTIKMIEKFDNLEGTILDPCLGSGNLLAACIIAGADPKKCYGIELDPVMLEEAKKRLMPMGMPEENFKLGDALKEESYEF